MENIRLKNINTLLQKYYYDIKEPVSFQSGKKLKEVLSKYINDIKLKEINEWLLNQKTYGVHKYYHKNFKRNPIVSKYIDHNWHGDLIEIAHPSANNNFRYILMIIDNLSKFGWAEKLKNKKTNTVLKAFKKIGRMSNRKPTIFTTDAGKEFTNYKFKNFLKKNKVKHFIARDASKAAVVERWNRTIKEKIYKYLTHNKTKTFINVLDDIIDGYNSTVHSRTKFKPKDVNHSNQKIVFRNLYKIKTQQEKNILKVNDKVRVLLSRNVFDKGYLDNYSKEIFFIHKILYTSPYFKYKVKDKKGIVVRGSYYYKELLKV